MYREFKGEYVKKGFTLKKIVKELNKRGYETTVSHLSQLLNGKHTITFNLAKELKDIIGSNLPLEVLFKIEEAG